MESSTTHRSEDVDVLVPGDQMRAFGDARSRLQLVSCQHPDLSRDIKTRIRSWIQRGDGSDPGTDLDPGVSQKLQRGPDVRLKLVLHPGQTQKLHLPLQTLHRRRHLQGAVVDAQLGLVVPVLTRHEMRKRRESDL